MPWLGDLFSHERRNSAAMKQLSWLPVHGCPLPLPTRPTFAWILRVAVHEAIIEFAWALDKRGGGGVRGGNLM